MVSALMTAIPASSLILSEICFGDQWRSTNSFLTVVKRPSSESFSFLWQPFRLSWYLCWSVHATYLPLWLRFRLSSLETVLLSLPISSAISVIVFPGHEMPLPFHAVLV